MRDGWKIKKLREVCTDFIVPQRDKPKSFDGDIPWCRIEDIEGKYLNGSLSGQKVSKALADEMNMHICPKGSVICACSASIGNQAITTIDCYTNQTFIGLVPQPGVLFNEFLYYFFKGKKNELLQMGTGATIKYISRKKFEELSIGVPPFQEQEKIVAELDCLTGIIEKKKQQLKELDNLAQSIFYDMFGDPITNEKGWEVKKLGDTCFPKKEIARANKCFKKSDTIQYIDISSIDNSQAILTGTTPFVFEDAPSRAQQKVNKGDVLVSLVRPNLKNIAMVHFEDVYLVASSGFCVLRGRLCNPHFIKSLVLTDRFTKYLTERTSGANYPAVREEDIKDCAIGVPPLELQSAFAQKIEAIEKQKELIKKSIQETETLFNSRMDYWFN